MKFLSSGHITWLRFFNISLPLSRLLFFASKHEPFPLTIFLSPFLKASAMACRVSLSSAKIILIKASIKWEWEKSRFFHRSRSEFMHWYLLRTEVKHPLSFTETKANRYSHWYVPQKVHHYRAKIVRTKIITTREVILFRILCLLGKNGACHGLRASQSAREKHQRRDELYTLFQNGGQ